jgi:hypothetical protein
MFGLMEATRKSISIYYLYAQLNHKFNGIMRKKIQKLF